MAAENNLAPLSDGQREALRALVFDTNAFPKGRLNRELLTRWSKLCETSNLEIWVPEPILWEWAEHAADDWHESTTAGSSARRALDAAGLEVPVSPYSSREEVIETVEASVRDMGGALRILPLTGSAAAEAIRDQILQRPPARKKEGTKTGASDSAWLRLLLDQADGDMNCVLIIGNDSDVNAAFKAWDIDEPRQVPLHQLESLLFVLDEVEDTIIGELVRFVRASTPSSTLDTPLEERRLVVGRVPDLAAKLEGLNGMPVNISDADITSIESLLGLSDIQMDRAHSTISATVYLLAEVEYLAWKEDSDGRILPEADRAGGFIVRDTLSFKWTDDHIVRGATDDDDAFVAEIDHAYYDPDDAARELLEALSCTPGIELPSELEEEGFFSEEQSHNINGRLITFDKLENGDGGWEVTISVRNGDQVSRASIACEFDASANPTEEPDLFPAWRMSTSGTPRLAAPGVWGAPQWLTERVWASDQA